MGRAYPRFLLSQSTQAKSKGTFILHSLEPPFLAEPEFNEVRQIVDVHIVQLYRDGTHYRDQAREIVRKEISNWWKYSGIHDSCDPRDKMISGLSRLTCIKDFNTPFTVEEAREVIKIIFPTKAKNFCHDTTTYGIKHDSERISTLFNQEDRPKYCSNDTIKEALNLEGFKTKKETPNSPNLISNIAETELKRMRKIAFYRINNMKSTESFL